MKNIRTAIFTAMSIVPLASCNTAGMEPAAGALVGGAGGAAIGAALSQGGLGGTLAGSAIGAMAGSAAGMPYAGANGASGSEGLPDTPQCQRYRDYARSAAGPMGTYAPLIDLYHECMNSAQSNPNVRRLQCRPGSYVHYVDGQKLCGRS